MAWEVSELPFDAPLDALIRLLWATYQDIADDSGLARLMCGVHPAIDTAGEPPIAARAARRRWTKPGRTSRARAAASDGAVARWGTLRYTGVRGTTHGKLPFPPHISEGNRAAR